MAALTSMSQRAHPLTLDIFPSNFPIRSSSSNYLNRCVEELRPEIATDHKTKALLWLTATVATIVALGALLGIGILAAGALTAAGFSFVPATIGFLGLTFFAIPHVLQYANKFLFNSIQALGQANALKEISQRFNELPTEGNSIVEKLFSMSILWSSIHGMQQPENLSVLNPLIARYDYWMSQKTLWEQKAQDNLAVVAELATQRDQPVLRIRITTHLQEAFQNQQEALTCKVYAAFTHAIIQRPDFTGDFGNLAQFVQVSLQGRAAAQELGARPLATELVRFLPNLNVQPITLDEIKAQPITVIAHRFIQAMPPAPAAV